MAVILAALVVTAALYSVSLGSSPRSDGGMRPNPNLISEVTRMKLTRQGDVHMLELQGVSYPVLLLLLCITV